MQMFDPEHYCPEHHARLTRALGVEGRVYLPRPIRLFAAILAVMVSLLIVGLFTIPWVQTAYGEGVVSTLSPDQRLQHVTALVNGRINRWYVREGDQVKAGDPMVEIVDNDPMLLERLKAERDAAARKYEVSVIASETSKIDFHRKEELFREGLSSRREMEEAKIAYKTMLAREAEAATELQKAEIQLSRQALQKITAPMDATVVSIHAGSAIRYVKEGDILASFVPSNAKPAIELFINGNDVPLVYPGRKVRLQFEGWPVVQFSGWPSLAVGTFGGVVTVVDSSVSPQGKFRILVIEDPEDPWPSSHFLRFGAKARGWVTLDTVRLGYELWRRLNDFPPEFGSAAEAGHATPEGDKS
jgi:biotin carboxyl carrier protein